MKAPILLGFGFAALAAACGGDDPAATSGGDGGAAASSSRASTSRASTGASSGASTASTGHGGGGAGGDGGDGGGGSAAGGGGSAPATCNGYEPCGVNAVAPPDGYTILAGLTVFNQSTNTSCLDFADCDMWNTHFDAMWTPPDNGWNRMGSPFPWVLSRYIIVVPPKRVTYAKFHVVAPDEVYRYPDGTPESFTDDDTHETTCFKRGPGALQTGMIGNLGGTGNLGKITWTISVLPGDMGNSGNASTCQGDGLSTLHWTTDPVLASTPNPATGKLVYCLLREGHDYYVNFQSSGSTHTTDCSTDACTMGGFVFSNPTTADGSDFVTKIPCSDATAGP